MEIKTLTLQEAFDKVLAHSRAMTHQSAEPNPAGPEYKPNCFYRAPDGNKCFAGALIPDELYKPNFEGFGIKGLMGKYPEIMKLLIGGFSETYNVSTETHFYRELQLIHDEYFNEREIKLAELAKKYNLEYSSLETV